MRAPRLEREVEHRSDQEWQRFLDRVVHDLSAPLRGIGASAGLLSEMDGDGLTGDARRLVQSTLDDVARMDRLLQRLAEYSMSLYAGGAPAGPVPCQVVVRSAIELLEPLIAAAGARIYFDDLPSVMGNWDQLATLFRDLLENAIRYRSAEPPNVTIAARAQQDSWLFAVSDNGIGIESQYWDRVFTPFQQLHSSHGAGLGLAICKRIVESHGGRMWVESKEGRGSTFFFTLPDAGEV